MPLLSKFSTDFICCLFIKNNLYKGLEQNNIGGLKFLFGILKGEYYEIEKSILNIANNLYIHKSFKLEKKIFIADYKISIFKHIDRVITEPLYLGGQEKNSISYKSFHNLLKDFPNRTEREKYCSARLSATLSMHFENRKEVIEKYEKYMNKKKSVQGKSLLNKFRNYEKNKYEDILEKLKIMLESEKLYNEKQWQKEMIDIIRLIFPKYVAVFDEVEIKDNSQKRRLDYLLIDAEGYIDIIEIKRPLYCQVVSKNTYRYNHYPIKELSGTVMQVEKYILALSKWGQNGETKLNEKYKNKLPLNFKIKITNPGAMIILGRSNNLSEEQKGDFEVIKRKYKNIIDIITYDDLIRRLETIISQILK